MQGLKQIMKNLSYLIVGGDDRFVELAKLYKQNGYSIFTYGMDNIIIENVANFEDLNEALAKTKVIIGPIPFAVEVNKVNAKYANREISIDELLSKVTSDQILIIGAINSYSRKLAERYKISYIDYYADECYQIMNTIPTVEGTLAIIISETTKTIYNSKILILGYGRIGKVLSEYLKFLGAEVYVEARKDYDLAWIEAKNHTAVPLNKISDYVGKMNIIINTIPSMILDQNLLDLVCDDTLLIDLASMPGGIDFGYAKSLGLKTIQALGIPGKVAYRSTANIIYNTINKILVGL